MPSKRELIATIGLGYVGLPVAVAFADAFDGAIGFDISARRVAELRDGHDRTGEVSPQALRRSKLRFTTDAADLRGAPILLLHRLCAIQGGQIELTRLEPWPEPTPTLPHET